MSRKKRVCFSEREQALIGNKADKTPGSIDWCWQTLYGLKMRWDQLQDDDGAFRQRLDDVKTWKVWEVVPPEQPYGSLDALLQAELGIASERAVEHTIRQRIQQAARQTDGQANSRGGDRISKCNLHFDTLAERAQANNISRRTQVKLDQIARKDTAIHQCVIAGTLSVAAAYRAAGLEKTPQKTPLDQIRTLWHKLSPDDQAHFLQEVQTPEEALV